jgi:ClpX C4-type zinc finger
VYICDQCISQADQVIATRPGCRHPLSSVKSIGKAITTAKCSFCGRRRYQVSGLAVAAQAAICTECLALCHEITAEELA